MSLRLRAWSDALAPAWQGLQQLVQEAPDHAGARAALASVAAARGWPRRADEEWRIARTLDDEDASLRVGALESTLRRAYWAELHRGLEQLAQDQPNHPGLPALRRQLALRQGYEMTAHAHQRAEPASAGASPGSSQSQGMRLYGPLQDGRWRLFTWTERTAAQKPGVFAAQRLRTGGGLRLEDPDGRLEAAVWQDEGSLRGSGASIDVVRAFGDHWRGSAGINSASADVPLRAVASGIRAQSLQWSVEHAWHESASTSLTWHGLNFSDGNRRQAWHWNAQAVPLNTPGWRLALQPSLGGSRNQRSDGPYFSPIWDAYVQLAGLSERHFLQGAQRRWRERVVLQVGRYQQAGFGAQPIADIGYEVNVGLSDALELGAGLVRLRRVYDGKAEMATTGQLRLQARF
jgi:biofilm PGA synthesis protein PgaA